ELLLKHRQVIVEREGKAPVAEKLAMKAFRLGTSSPFLYQFGSKVAPNALAPFTSDDRISKGPGPLKAWTESREFPAPNKERF
ncbi:lactate utilisation protein LutB domain-containing protein, partial [Bacillus altitudinis]